MRTSRDEALEILEDNLSPEMLKHIDKVESLRDYIIDSIVNYKIIGNHQAFVNIRNQSLNWEDEPLKEVVRVNLRTECLVIDKKS